LNEQKNLLASRKRADEPSMGVTKKQEVGVAAVMAEELLIDQVTDVTHGVYQPYGWHHWPKYPWMSYQFRRALGETQEGGGAVSECFLAASRMIPGDKESWHREWKRIADFNQARGDEEFGKGHVRTAMNCWLRAANY
jgi:hypothetical protein